MKSHKEYKNEYQRWTEEIQALNEAVQCDTKKWKIIGCFFALFASLSFCGSFFAACFICEIATITNLTLSVCITILGFCFWLVLIFYKVTPKVFPKIPLTNNDKLWRYSYFNFRDKWVYKYIDEFKQFDEKRIVIDATNPTRRGAPIFFLLIVIILPLLGIYSFQGGNNNFAENYTIILINC
ncbi:putative transmembrane protein, partial [Bacteroides fragilis str. J-143-4]